jgi:dihydrofolate synthase/folylpolyglutamate synthase
MNYQEALAYIYGFSDFERTGKYSRDREDNIARMTMLLNALGDPHRDYPATHIAGTKGKGSTAALIESALRHAGYHTGLYTQPDLHTFRERIRVDGRLIREDEVAELLPEVQQAVDALMREPAYGAFITYEVATALMFLFFSRRHIDHAVVEVGLGGRLDATNVLQSAVAVITSISYDHMQILGNTLGAIAFEKAGIIKPGIPVVSAWQHPEALAVIRRVCAERHAPLTLAGPAEAGAMCDYRYRLIERGRDFQRFAVASPDGEEAIWEIPLRGEHQLLNATVALATLEKLRAGGMAIPPAAIAAGFRAVSWPGRMQVVGERPTIVIDGAHNAESMERLLAALRQHFSFARLIFVLGLLSDKDLHGIAEAIDSQPAQLVLTQAISPRAMALEVMAAAFRAVAPGVPLTQAPTIAAAMAEALRVAHPDDLICVAGSIYLAGEALRWAASRPEAAGRDIVIEGVDH